MDISIACSDPSPTPELQPGETATAGRIFLPAAGATATSLAVQGETGSTGRCAFVEACR
jgi:hypothetical protein